MFIVLSKRVLTLVWGLADTILHMAKIRIYSTHRSIRTCQGGCVSAHLKCDVPKNNNKEVKKILKTENLSIFLHFYLNQ